MTSDPRLQRLSAALVLEQEIQRKTRLVDLAHTLVNDTARVHGQDLAFLCLKRTRGVTLQAATAVGTPDRTGPLAQWLARLGARLHDVAEPRVLDRKELDLPAEDWSEGLPAYCLWLPLADPRGGINGALVLFRHAPWQDADRLLAEPLAVCYGHALWAMRGRLPTPPKLTRRQKMASAAVAALLIVFPVRLDTIAPAEVAPADPIPITAPFDGIVLDVAVRSYQAVRAGDLLAVFDARELAMKREVTARQLDLAEAELDSLRNLAFVDPESKAKLAVAEQRVALERENLAYAENRLSRHRLVAPEDGVVLYDDRFGLRGRPVATGQSLMTVAKPERTELHIDIPVGGIIPTELGAEIRLFLDMDPSRAIDATLTRIGYEARPAVGGGLAYRYVAAFDDPSERVQLGARGSAKITGGRVPLIYYLFRRPWASLRQFLGI